VSLLTCLVIAKITYPYYFFSDYNILALVDLLKYKNTLKINEL